MGWIVDEVCRELESVLLSPTSADALDTIARQAWLLRPVAPHERHGVLRNEAALLIDRLLVRVARGRGALDIAVGERLALLADGAGSLRLGYSGIGDYARERLGIAARTAQDLSRLSRELRDRPLLREAVRSGEVSARKAQVVLPVARGDDEAGWVARAKDETVRALEAAVKEAGGAPADDDERWQRIWVNASPQALAALDEAMGLAGKLLGATSPKSQRLEAICQEYLGAHSERVESAREPEDEVFHTSVGNWLEAAKAALEAETRWAFLDAAEPVATPEGPASVDPQHLDGELRRLVVMREGWDELVGHLAMLFRDLGLWQDALFASFGHYCSQRLGMAARTVEQRIWLERRLYALPRLREAMRDGRLSYEKARLVAQVADDSTVEACIARAEPMTCIELRRELEAQEEAQICAQGVIDLRVPERVVGILGEAFRAVRAVAGRWLEPGECLEIIARHFIDTWKQALAERSTPHRRVLARDRGLCQVPGCSRAALHAHHVRYRSSGGGDEPENLVSLCAAHHLHGVHRGFIRVHGQAPDALCWELGVGTSSSRRVRNGA